MSVILYSSEGITLSQVFFGSLLIWRYVALIRLYLCSHTSLSLFTVIFFLFFFFYCSAFSLGEYISVPLTVLGHPTPSRCYRVLLVLLARNFSSTFITVLLLLLLSFLQVFDRKITTFSVQQWSIVRCFLNQEPASQTLGISFQGMLSSLMKW